MLNGLGGYTRIHKFGHRPGDNAPTAILERLITRVILSWKLRRVQWGGIIEGKLQTKDVSDLLQKGVRVRSCLSRMNLLGNERKLDG